MINNIVLVSGVQQSDSVIHISIFFFKFLFPFRLLLFSHQVVSDSLQPHGNILGFPVPPISHSLPKFVSIESVMLSNHLILCRPLLLLPSIFPSIRVFASELGLRIMWPKYWNLTFSISPSNEYSELMTF